MQNVAQSTEIGEPRPGGKTRLVDPTLAYAKMAVPNGTMDARRRRRMDNVERRGGGVLQRGRRQGADREKQTILKASNGNNTKMGRTGANQ